MFRFFCWFLCFFNPDMSLSKIPPIVHGCPEIKFRVIRSMPVLKPSLILVIWWYTTESPFTFNTLDKRAVYLCNQKWNVDINVFIFSFFLCAYIQCSMLSGSSKPDSSKNYIGLLVRRCWWPDWSSEFESSQV